MASVNTGQNALQQLPSSSRPNEDSIISYELDGNLQTQRKSLSSSSNDSGFEVLKVSKNGKLYPRRLAFSPDHRSIFVTTNRIRSVKNFFKYALQTNREVTARTIDISAIDHILPGQQTKRFGMARIAALASDGDSVMKLMLESEVISLSLVYRVPADTGSSVMLGIPMIDSHLPSSISSSSKQGHTQRFETLDLILPNQHTYETLFRSLEDLVSLHQEERERYARNILLLQLHWGDLGKQLSDSMSSSEWLLLCDKMNIPMTKTDHLRLFKNYEKQLNEGEGMLFSYVGEIMEDIEAESLNDPCDRLWSEVVATDPIPAVKLGRADDDASLELLNDEEEEETISAVAFLSFIRSQQKQFSASLEDTIALIHTLNNQVSWDDMEGSTFDVTEDTRIASLDRLGKTRFVAFLLSDYNDLFDPAAGELVDADMSRPLSDYWIHTSHDTYLTKSAAGGGGFGGLKRVNCADGANGTSGRDLATDEQMYMYALQRGVRCLELDLWDGVTGEPVISRVKPTGTENTIPLAVALRNIRGFLKYNSSSYPIILRLENHCSYEVQQKVAQQITKILGSANFLAKPDGGEVSERSPLPSPDSIRGKVLIMGKRPPVIEEGAKVLNDDYDDENDATNEKLYQHLTFDEEECDEMNQNVIGFNSSGPIVAASTIPDISKQPSLEDVCDDVVKAADSAKQEASLAEARAARLQFEAAEAEKLAAQLTQEAGLTPAEVKASAASAPRNRRHGSQGVEVQLDSNNSGADDEGLEVQEFLHDEVKGSRHRYSSVIAEAIQASELATSRLQTLNTADYAFRGAETSLYQARQREKELAEQSRRAAVEARCNREHAESAKRRVSTVRDLLKKCEENSNSARTVVVTATTEAKISERRAAEAESRASRALASADRDRTRADDETKKEERLEEEASKLHGDRSEAGSVAQLARERVEKAAAMLERVDEQIKLVEKSDQFRKEIQQCPSSSAVLDFPFLAKHAAKVEEKELCKDLIKEASNENAKADGLRRSVQEKFEEKAQMWKIQAEIAAQVRKQADRSAMLGEELAEHAEEERDAATLRHVAREKAESNVQQRSSHLESVQAQLTEAERAATEAAALAVDTRHRADHLAQDAEGATNYKSKIRAVEDFQGKKELAAADYEAARIIKDEKDDVAADTKRLLETNAEVYTSAVRDAAAASHRVNSDKVYERKAILAYDRALLCRKQADHANALSKIALAASQEKGQAARQAQEYKSRSSRISPIPVILAKLTWLHTTRHKYWEKTLNMPNFHVLSMAQQAFAITHSKDPKTIQRTMRTFTRSHLCRIFPSTHSSSTRAANYDPVLAWSLGCQLVSMKAQSPGEHFLVGEGRFRQNGSCGYVLKPSALTKASPAPEKEQRWRIRVLRGSYLPKPESPSSSRGSTHPPGSSRCISPYVKIVLLDGENPISQESQHCTHVVNCNGLHPVWDEHEQAEGEGGGFEFVVTKPYVAMLSVVVYDAKSSEAGGLDDFVAGAAIPISNLRQGYRSVALFDASHTRCGAYAFASLLVNCQKIS